MGASDDGGCFLASAAEGGPAAAMAQTVKILREVWVGVMQRIEGAGRAEDQICRATSTRAKIRLLRARNTCKAQRSCIRYTRSCNDTLRCVMRDTCSSSC